MKKLLAICLSVLLLCSAMPFAFVSAAEEATIVVSDVEGKAGDIVSVKISLKNNPGIVSTKIGVGYDASVLELVLDPEDESLPSVEYGAFPAGGYSFGPVTNNPFVVNWCYTLGKDCKEEDLMTLKFKIKEDAAAGTYPLTLTYDCEEDFYNKAWDVIDFAGDEGSVTVVEDAPVVPDEPVYTNPTIVLPNVEADAGDEISVNISLKNNPGIVSTKIGVGYDASVLELVLDPEDASLPSVEYGVFPAGGYSFGPVENNPFVVNWCYTLGKDCKEENLMTLKFKVKDDAVSGTYPLTLTYDCDEDFYNKAWDVIYFDGVEGSVIINGVEPEEPECTHSYESACDPICDLCGESRPVHTEGIVHFDAVDAGCHYIGNIEYWFCSECASYWSDEALTQEIAYEDTIVSALGGEVSKIDAVAPGCHYNGNIAYWICYECEQVWQDEALTQLTNSKNVILPAIGGEVEHVKAVEPTCTATGNIEYWYCAECEQYWQDEALTQLTNSKNVKIGTIDHTIVHFDAVDAGCHYIGNIEYWFCSECESYWSDEALTLEIAYEDTIIPVLGGEVSKIDAVAPGCHYNGNIAYWICYECEQVWQDEALTQLTNSKNVILPAVGSDNLQHVKAVEPTCTATGNIEYWYCPDCEQYWQDEALTQLTNSKNVKIGTIDHTIVYMKAVDAGCHYIGNIEYWYCSGCGACWSDEALTQEIAYEDTIVSALGGDVSKIDAVAPGCHYNGNIAYWICYECEQVWQDEALTQLTNSKNVILPAVGSDNLQHVDAVAPTCEATGNIEYWFCPDCEQVWVDEALTQLSNLKNVKLGIVDHTIVHMDAVAPGCHYVGNIEYWFCSACGAHWADEALTLVTNANSVILPAVGGETIHFEAVEAGCHYIGNIEYWYCAECEQYWQDEALTQLTNSKNILTPATGSDKLVHNEYKAPTATEDGYVEHWFCGECEQFWTDEALTQLTNSKNIIIPATGEVEPDSPATGDSTVAVVVALLTLIASGVAVSVLKNKKHA